MTEKKVLIENEVVQYEGLFNLTELYRLIDKFLNERGFDKFERFNEEKVTASGKDIDVLLEPGRQVSDYSKHKMKIRLYIKGMKDVEVEKDGIKIKLNQGKLRIEFAAYLISDIEGKWQNSPTLMITRFFTERFIFKRQMKTQEVDLVQQTRHLKTLVKSFLNLHRY